MPEAITMAEIRRGTVCLRTDSTAAVEYGTQIEDRYLTYLRTAREECRKTGKDFNLFRPFASDRTLNNNPVFRTETGRLVPGPCFSVRIEAMKHIMPKFLAEIA